MVLSGRRKRGTRAAGGGLLAAGVVAVAFLASAAAFALAPDPSGEPADRPPAIATVGPAPSSSTTAARRAGKGKLVAKDSAGRRPKAAVARVTLDDFRRVTYEVRSRPGRLPVDWSFTARCMKGWLIDYYPGPGDHRTKRKRTTIKGTFKVPLANPDHCTFAVFGEIAKLKTGKRVIVKIYKRG